MHIRVTGGSERIWLVQEILPRRAHASDRPRNERICEETVSQELGRFDESIQRYFHCCDTGENPARGQPGHGKLFHVRRSWMSCCHSKCKSNYHAHLAATHVLAGQSATRVGRDAWLCWTPVQPAHRVRHVSRSANENYRRVFALTREYSDSNGHSRKQHVRWQRSDLALQNGMRHVVDDLRWRVSGGLRKCQHWSYSVELVLDK